MKRSISKGKIILAAVFCLVLALMFMITFIPKSVNADSETNYFKMKEAELRVQDDYQNSGIRFIVACSEDVKAKLQSAKEVGFLIAPKEVFGDAASSFHTALADKIEYKFDNLDGLYQDADGRWCLNVVLAPVGVENFNKNFCAIAYYKTDVATKYAYLDQYTNYASVYGLATEKYFDVDTTAAEAALVADIYNLGNEQTKAVAGDANLNGTVEDGEQATLPAKVIEVGGEAEFKQMLDLNHKLSYKLTENFYLTSYTVDTYNCPDFFADSFSGKLDGNGKTITMTVNYKESNNYKMFLGLIKNIQKDAVIKDLIFNATVDCNYDDDHEVFGYMYQGRTRYGANGILAYICDGTISNCVFETNIKTPGNVTVGVVGIADEHAVFENILIIDNSADIGNKILCKGYDAKGTTVFSNIVYVGIGTHGTSSSNSSYNSNWYTVWPQYCSLDMNEDGVPDYTVADEGYEYATFTDFYAYGSLEDAITGTNGVKLTASVGAENKNDSFTIETDQTVAIADVLEGSFTVVESATAITLSFMGVELASVEISD